MPTIVPIIEGDGEIEAVPILLRRFQEIHNRWDINVLRPLNAKGRGNLTKENGLEHFLDLATRKPDCQAIFVIMDSEDECPKEDILPDFVSRAAALTLLQPIFFVFPKYNFESWFVASLRTIRGERLGRREGIDRKAKVEGNIESRNGKAILNQWMPSGRNYKETMDQAWMTQLMNFALVRERSRSFRRMEHAFQEIIDAIDNPPERGYVSPSLDRIEN